MPIDPVLEEIQRRMLALEEEKKALREEIKTHGDKSGDLEKRLSKLIEEIAFLRSEKRIEKSIPAPTAEAPNGFGWPYDEII